MIAVGIFLCKKNLELSDAGLGELEDDATASKAAVDIGVGVESVVNTTTLLLVKDDLEGLGAVLLVADALADNLDGVDEVGQDSIVHSGESARAGALLLLEIAGAGRALGLGEDAASSKDQDVAVRELLLELTGEAVKGRGGPIVRIFSCHLREGGKKKTYRCWTRWKP